MLAVKKRSLPWVIAGVVLLAAGVPAWQFAREASVLRSLPPAQGASPNVLLIVVDTLRADHLSAYGYARNTSPNLARIAAQGVMFDNAIAPASWTVPSHASLLTGVYPHDHRTELDYDVLGTQWPTVGEVLLGKGYRTAAFSANVLNFSRGCGLARGFIHFEDYYGAKPTTLLTRVPLAWRMQLWLQRFGLRDFIGRQDAADINRRALAWIDRDKRPFFVMLNYFDVHDPYRPPEPYRHAFTTQADPGGSISTLFDKVEVPDKRTMAAEMAAYDGGIRYVDDQIQNLMNALRDRSLLDNTIVVITSDHGEAFGEHNFVSHRNGLYREVIHVPLIVWNPKTVPAARHISRPVSLVDIPRTLIEFAAPGFHGSFPGRPLQTLWAGGGSQGEWPEPLSELAQVSFRRRYPNYAGPVRSVIGPEYQYISQKSGELLFDWSRDPKERHNVCLVQPNACASLRAKLNSIGHLTVARRIPTGGIN